MAIWVIKDGQREGPYEEQDVRELIYEGTYGDADPAIRDGQYDWSTLGQILGRGAPTYGAPLVAADVPPPAEAPPELPTADPEPPPLPVATPEAVATPDLVATPEPIVTPEPMVTPEPVTPVPPAGPMPVAVVDFQMPFTSMLLFMFKWLCASLLALLALGIVAGIFWAACAALIAGLLQR